MSEHDALRAWISDYYGTLLTQSADLKTNACCATGAPPRWMSDTIAHIHEDVLARFYGCGFPIPEALDGAVVLDLGCGTGRDVYMISQLVGPGGFVHGVDMTAEQLEVAQRTQSWHMDRFGYEQANVAFHKGFIEDLSMIPDASVDVVVSNCVVNLSPRKDLVMAEVARVLKTGGEFYFSDVFADRRLPQEIAQDPILHAECLGGALYPRDFEALARANGFIDPRVLERAPITIQNAEIERMVGAASFESVTYRLFKLPELDAQCEDYGQLVTYRGTLVSSPSVYWLDDHHAFEAGRPERVCGNTAAMLTETRLGEHFVLMGDTSTHYGAFACVATDAATQYAGRDLSGRGGKAAAPAASCCGPSTSSSSGCC